MVWTSAGTGGDIVEINEATLQANIALVKEEKPDEEDEDDDDDLE